MTISDALPIQFWYNGIPTYNEYDPGAPFDHILFYQEFLNTDDQIVQFRDTTGLTFYLQVFDCDGVQTNILPFVEIATGVYEVTFNPGDLGIVNVKRQFKIQRGDIIGSTTVENQISIDEFVSDMDDWVNATHRPDATLQDLDDFQQRDVSSPLPATNWAAQPSGPMIGKPYRSFPTFYTSPSYTRIAYIEFDGLNAYSYDLNIKLDIAQNIAFTINFSAVIIFYDSSFNTLGTDGFIETNFAPGVKSFDFTIPSGIGNVAYIGIRIFDDSVHTYMTTLTVTWFERTVYNPTYANWAWSSDNSGSLKLTTVTTTDVSVVSKTVTLPQENHYIRFKLQLIYPKINPGIRLLFKVYDGATVIFSQLLSDIVDGDEHLSIVNISNPMIWTVASSMSLEITDNDGNFVNGDVLYVNSVEIYTTTTTFITAFVEVAKSDFVSFPNIIDSAIYIQYKSIKNFAGIYYTPSSPYLSIRIPGIFQIENPVTEQKDIDLSNSRVINTASQLKIKKEFEIFECTDYMHKKIILILQHAISGSIIINNVEWTIGDEYKKERADTMFILSRASTLLTRRNYLEGNVI